MAQDYSPDCYALTDTVDDDMTKIEKNFECLRTSFSGAATPLLAEGLIWLETTTNKVRVRNAGASAWMGVLTGDINQKLWVYRNDTMAGWVIDESVVDTVLALRGGQYGVTGGVEVGTWTQPPHVHHYVVEGSNYTHSHTFTIPGGTFSHAHTVTTILILAQAGLGEAASFAIYPTSLYTSPSYGSSTSEHTPPDWATDTEDGATTPDWRPQAAVGTLQYLDVTP